MKKILFIMDELDSISPLKDTTYLFMLECQNRGYEIYYSLIDELFFDSILYADCLKVEMEEQILSESVDRKIYKAIDKVKISLEKMDVIFMRKDPPIDLNYIHSTYMLDTIKNKVLIVNDPTSLRSFNEKLVTLKFKNLIPPTIITSSIKKITDFAKGFTDGVVIKPISLCGGEGVFRFVYNSENSKNELENELVNNNSMLIIQKFLPNVSNGDKRIIILNGNPIGAINRIAQEGSFICNFHSGGKPKKTYISESEAKICNYIKNFLVDNKIYFAGIDVIDNRLTEINITSPTGVQEINRANKSNLEKIVLDFIVDKLN